MVVRPPASSRHRLIGRVGRITSCSDSSADLRHEELIRLERELREAVASEEYESAARLRDARAELILDAEVAVLAANAAFYRAFNRQDEAAMAALWSNSRPNVCATHPGHAPIFGLAEVMDSWRDIFSVSPLRVEPSEIRTQLLGGGSACVTCMEELSPGEGKLSAVNVFALEPDGRWALVHHQAGPLMEQDEGGDDGDDDQEEEEMLEGDEEEDETAG